MKAWYGNLTAMRAMKEVTKRLDAGEPLSVSDFEETIADLVAKGHAVAITETVDHNYYRDTMQWQMISLPEEKEIPELVEELKKRGMRINFVKNPFPKDIN